MKDRSRSKERGVVLLSCLIFLLMLLALLRFSLNTAKMEEIKAGADYDQMSAKEAANITMMDAEYDVKRMTVSGTSMIDPSITKEEDIIGKAIDYWSDPSKFKGRVGVYNGDTTISCKADPKDTTPLYATKNCVKWEEVKNCSSGEDGGAICYGGVTKAKVIGSGQGKYIIERFMGNGPVLQMGSADERVVILRVTAVGFSKPEKSGDNTSQVMLQNTYVLASGG